MIDLTMPVIGMASSVLSNALRIGFATGKKCLAT
jgi:hypothetical protein